MKTGRKLFGNETGRDLAGLPPGMGHQGREKRNIVTDAVDHECIERIALRGDCHILLGARVTSLAIMGS